MQIKTDREISFSRSVFFNEIYITKPILQKLYYENYITILDSVFALVSWSHFAAITSAMSYIPAGFPARNFAASTAPLAKTPLL